MQIVSMYAECWKPTASAAAPKGRSGGGGSALILAPVVDEHSCLEASELRKDGQVFGSAN